MSKFLLKWAQNPIWFSVLGGKESQKPQNYASNIQTKQIGKTFNSSSSSSAGILWNYWHTGVCCQCQLAQPR